MVAGGDRMKKVAVIGGGIVGSTCAFYLAKMGVSVDLYDVEKGQATAAAVGIICPWISQRRNKEWYDLVCDGAIFYKKMIGEVSNSDFYTQSGALFLHDRNLEKLYRLALSRQEKAEIMGEVAILEDAQLNSYIMDGVNVKRALYIEGAACIDGKECVDVLKHDLKMMGGRIINQQVILSKDNPKCINDQVYDDVVVASGAWIQEVFQNLNLTIDVKPQKGQLIGFSNLIEEDRVYPYIIPQGELDIMFDKHHNIIVGASHENEKGYDLSEDEAIKTRLHLEACQYLPFLKDKEVGFTRIGTRAHSSDFNPFYGEVPGFKGIYAASALGSSGLTSGPVIAYRIAEAIVSGAKVYKGESINRYIQHLDQ